MLGARGTPASVLENPRCSFCRSHDKHLRLHRLAVESGLVSLPQDCGVERGGVADWLQRRRATGVKAGRVLQLEEVAELQEEPIFGAAKAGLALLGGIDQGTAVAREQHRSRIRLV